MNMHIRTVAEGCHLTVKIKTETATLLRLTGNDEKHVDLLPGTTYIFEWIMSGTQDAHIGIDAQITPPNAGFLPLQIDKSYPPGAKDGNVFLFTLQ